MTTTKQTELLPCPFCGDTPELPDGDGTQYEIECSGCGQAMASVQICDLMTLQERSADTFKDHRYGEEFIERAKVQAIEHWNTRAQSAPEPVQGEAVGVVEQFNGVACAQLIEWLPAGTKLYTSPAKPDAELLELLRNQLTWHQERDKELSKSGRSDGDYHWRRLQHQEQIAIIDAKLAELQK